MSIALLYERSENDENGIKLTAQQLGVDLTFLPFRKIAFSISKEGFAAKTKGKDYTGIIKDVAVVLNRAQSKNRRLQASYFMEQLGKKTLNTSQVRICLLQQTAHAAESLEGRLADSQNRLRSMRPNRHPQERERNPQRERHSRTAPAGNPAVRRHRD